MYIYITGQLHSNSVQPEKGHVKNNDNKDNKDLLSPVLNHINTLLNS